MQLSALTKSILGAMLATMALAQSQSIRVQMFDNPPPNDLYNLENLDNCAGFKMHFSKSANLWVYVYSPDNSPRGIFVLDSCAQADYTGRSCAVIGGPCHQIPE
ncbi:hypothetical protein B0I37DRAFT_351940 [Chaetomium sp. MPI-CAGE-AT-0009]|nr:hypothetical protein B0I37DRAFT_351940 [Chaetomium sp. MPI-CAGE-AT-0009]